MKIKTITLYNFSELSEQAQNRAAHKYQDLIQDIYEENVNNILEPLIGQKEQEYLLTKKIYHIQAFTHKETA